MGKKYMDTKAGTLESSILGVWKDAAVKEDSREEGRHDGRTKAYREHRAKLEAARTRREEKKMDKVNPKALKKDFDDRKDKDIDNDGDVDDSDEYLHNRRKTVSKAVKKEGLEDKTDNPANSQHMCAKNVVHEEWGAGQPIHGQHADPDENGEIAWYDVMFEHGIEKGVSINELKVTKEAMHNSHNKDHDKENDGKKVLKAKKQYGEEVELDEASVTVDLENDDPKLLKDIRRMGLKIKDNGSSGNSGYNEYTITGPDSKLKAGGKKFGWDQQVESYEIGTDEYRDHTLEVTPGQSLTWGSANAYKQASMKEALAKVWGLDEKALDKSEEDDKIAPVKGKKSMTGGKVADVAVDPDMKSEALGHGGAEKLGPSKDRNFQSAASHIDYHFRRAGGHQASSAGERDRLRHQIARKLGYRV